MALLLKTFEENEKDQWNDFISNSLYGDILQYWQWGETKISEGWKPMHFAVIDEDDQKIFLAALVLIKKASVLGNLIYIGHGPVFSDKHDLKKALPILKKGLIEFSKKNNVFGIEIEPKICYVPEEDLSTPIITKNLQSLIDPAIIKIFDNNGFIKTGRNMQPRYKLFYDLDMEEDQLLGLMKKNTRYNVRLAERKGVDIKEYSLDDPEIDKVLLEFYSMLIETQKRAQGYPIRSLVFFKELIQRFKGMDNIVFTEAKYQGQVISMNISQRTKSWSSSFYASSVRKFTEVKAPYLMRWKSVLSAKKYGSKIYDFWGIIPNSIQHQGYSENKLSFGGVRIDMYGILALPIKNVRYLIWDRSLKIRARVYNIFRR